MEELRVVLFTSRNKDNKGLEGFKKRTKSFLSTKTEDELAPEFKAFRGEGVEGEFSRFYLSVNGRDNDKIRKGLLHYLIDHEEQSMAGIPQRVASIAAKAENRKESNWLFDFDGDPERIQEFIHDVRDSTENNLIIQTFITPNGFAVVVNQGFDTRELLDKWEDVTLMRDDMLCVDWGY